LLAQGFGADITGGEAGTVRLWRQPKIQLLL